jgi:hypothetical protein
VAAQFACVFSPDQRPDAELTGRRWQAVLNDPLHVRDFTAESAALLEFFRSEAELAELQPWIQEADGAPDGGGASTAPGPAAAGREWLEDSFLSYADAISELASAQAELGDLAKAADTAVWDETGRVGDKTCAAAAKYQADDDDIPGALATARQIRDPRIQAQALRAVGQAMARKGEPEQARAMLADAADRIRTAAPAVAAVPALLEIGKAYADTGYRDAIATALAAARDCLAGISRQDDRDEMLSQIAQNWAVHGDIGHALEIAQEIGNPGRTGEALFTAAVAAGARDDDCWGRATAIIDTIESPWWRAAGLAAVAGVKTGRHCAHSRPYFSEAQTFLNQIPQGEFRARLEGAIIELMLECGNYDIALRIARNVTVDRDQALTALVTDLADRGAANAVKQLLPDCARYAHTAFGACLALARVVLAQADVIATEIGASS